MLVLSLQSMFFDGQPSRSNGTTKSEGRVHSCRAGIRYRYLELSEVFPIAPPKVPRYGAAFHGSSATSSPKFDV